MNARELAREALTLAGVLAIVGVIALLFGGADAEFLRSLGGEWLWWIGGLALVMLVFGGWRWRRRR